MQETALTPFDRIGGRTAIARIVDRFYDLMDGEPRFAALRAMHGADLGPMRHSLTGFLTGWAGGPRDWFEQNPDKCMMSAHGGLPITPKTAAQWIEAMAAAFADCGLADHPVGVLMMDRFKMMARGMAGNHTTAD
ncbi:group II truncated hemoglobin [Altererythrobacter sp. KTW20L]|uniref:group II truncated hemoglobin n=1 Tax=Altererythrobacter sp. KTW20L TaxID=2942210 RepID=UPI0020BF456C|nr:group II truncated hemoglobin [Altererythrobacter sp. KTW20L]MCL6249928.1 group II truncated hemoglobin [Altererythrobacter sp. KTW20L]